MARTRKNSPISDHKNPIFVAYYRVSDIKQGKSGLGLDAQRTSVERYLGQVKGELVDEYTEVESGKSHKNRPQLAAAIASSKRHGATLLIAKLDRLARNVHFISGLMESAADFVIVDMPSANRLTIHILASIAEHEREMISARTKAALAEVVKRGVKLGNPRWQDSIEKARAARRKPPGAVEIRTIIESYLRQGLTLRAMAARLNELGIKTPTGATWYASSVRAMLIRTGLASNDAAALEAA
jgi:DNA invertase Pin-like site-specific DNA recombinase